jgi:hypothetical protein
MLAMITAVNKITELYERKGMDNLANYFNIFKPSILRIYFFYDSITCSNP